MQDNAFDTAYCKTLTESYTADSKLFIQRLKYKATDKKVQKYYKLSYETIFEFLKKNIADGQVFYMPSLNAMLNKTLESIKVKNPSVPTDIKILLVREAQPNAYTVGDDYVFVNMGVFRYLENEAQLTAIISHEVGHILLEHSLTAMYNRYEKNKEHITDLKFVKQAETHIAEHAMELLRNSIYHNGKISRAHELQADSIGFMLYKNIGFPKQAFTEALAVVERYEQLRLDGLTTETYKRFFDLPTQPFNDKWLKVEDFSSYNYNAYTKKINEDSASSHPKSKERIKYLQAIYPELKEETKTSGFTASFSELRKVADNQHLPNLYYNEEYGVFIYTLLVQLQTNPDNKLYKDWLGKGFMKIYEARKAYQLNRYVERIAPKEQTKSYIQFLSFMWNLKLEEMEKIAVYYQSKS